MGLDMYMFRARKLTPEEVEKVNGKEMEEIYKVFGSDVSVFTAPRIKNSEHLIKDLKPFLTPIKVISRYWNIEKIKTEKDVPKEYEGTVMMRSFNKESITLGIQYFPPLPENIDEMPEEEAEEAYKQNRDNTVYIEITIAEKDINNYTIQEEEDAYAVHLEEMMYWRKNYDLQRSIYRGYDGIIDNCGYHRINGAMMRAIRRHDRKEVLKGVRLTKDMFYHEWY